MMHYASAPVEFKAGDQSGTFEAYGAVFGNRDDGGDIIEAGAFKKIRTKSNGRIRIPLYHDMSRVVGEGEVVQDGKGLKVKGYLNMNLSYAADAYELMKDGTLDSMSVGFNIMKGGHEWDEKYTTRTIRKAELWEVSIVPFGMNRKAKIQTVKDADGGLPEPREFEAFLREIGFSRRESKAIISCGYSGLLRDAADHDGDVSDSEAGDSAMLLDLKQTIAETYNIQV